MRDFELSELSLLIEEYLSTFHVLLILVRKQGDGNLNLTETEIPVKSIDKPSIKIDFLRNQGMTGSGITKWLVCRLNSLKVSNPKGLRIFNLEMKRFLSKRTGLRSARI